MEATTQSSLRRSNLSSVRGPDTISAPTPVAGSARETAQAKEVQTLQLFPYKTLDTSVDSIRLLYLHSKNPWQSVDVINCSLHHTNFMSKPTYEALSYTWGDEQPVKTIFIDDTKVIVRDNLYSALSILRVPNGRTIWVDAICIDQSNLEERQYQVGLMDHIYHQAKNVIIWLGNPPPGLATEFWPDSLCVKKEWAKSELYSWLYDHHYWKRLWIIQEIGLSKRLTVHIGHHNSEWNKFISDLEINHFDFVKNGRYVKMLHEKRNGRHGSSNRLETLLEDFQYAECKEVRDKVYGFLGLAHDCNDESILPDYTKPLFKLHEEVIKHFCHRRLLPDGSSSKLDRAMRVVRFSQLVQRLLEYPGPAPLTAEQRNSPDIIHVRGNIGSEVDFLGPFYNEIISSHAANKKWRGAIDTYCKLPKIVENVRKEYEAYSTLLNHPDSDFYKYHGVHPLAMYSKAMLTNFEWEPDESNWTLKNPQEANSDDSRNPMSETKDVRDMNDVPSIVHTVPAIPGPRMFLGKRKTMGLVPGETEIGDIICQFWQTDVTAVLRKEEKTDIYRIVGRAHLSTGYLTDDLTPKFLPWKEPRKEASEVDIQLDIPMLAFLTC